MTPWRTFPLLLLFAFGGGSFADDKNGRLDLALRQGFEEEFTQNDQAHAYRETVYTLNASSKDPLGYRHQYRVFDLPDRDDVSPATNGHLHATGPVFRFSAGTAEVTLHPLMAVSSNVLRETRDFEFRDLQPHGKAAWQAPALADGQWRWGLQSDSRWGRMLAYPHVSWESAGEGPLQLSLGLPDSALVWTPARAWTVSMDVGPDGGEWRVRDAEFERTSTFRERRWRWAGSVTRTFGPHASLSGGVEYAFERRWEYTLENGETQQISPPNAPMLFAAVQVGF